MSLQAADLQTLGLIVVAQKVVGVRKIEPLVLASYITYIKVINILYICWE